MAWYNHGGQVKFLIDNLDPDERAYPDPADQIREVLIHGNYLSRRDIGICLAFDIEVLKDHEGAQEIRVLHEVLAKGSKTDAPSGSA